MQRVKVSTFNAADAGIFRCHYAKVKMANDSLHGWPQPVVIKALDQQRRKEDK